MKIITLSGPSGVGKNTLVAEVLKAMPELQLGSSLTTRQPRPSDVPGKYTYVSRPEFKQRAASGDLLEWAEYNGDLYGTLQPEGEGPWLLEIEIQGAAQVKKQFPDTRRLFVVPPGDTRQEQMQVLATRLHRRGTEQPAIVQQRMQRAEAELQQGLAQSDKVIVNDDLAAAARETAASIRSYLNPS